MAVTRRYRTITIILAVSCLMYEFVWQVFLSGRYSRGNCNGLQDRGIKGKKRFRILLYDIPRFLQLRPDAMFSGFEECANKNCIITYINSELPKCDAVVFSLSTLPQEMPWERPPGQVWILYENEPAPTDLSPPPGNWFKDFNWTISYNKRNADIHLPYGNILKQQTIKTENALEIANSKNKTALIIMSRCNTASKRQIYLKELAKHVSLDIYGHCGIKWDCGKRYMHDSCFDILKEYKFYLAFESSFCNDYFTEKVFENFDYDTILVTRGGIKGEIKQILPEGTYVPAEDFKNAKELGQFLSSMTTEKYVSYLAKKKEYLSESYTITFRNAMCEVCHRLNNIHNYNSVKHDMMGYWNITASCTPPYDMSMF